MSDSWAKPFEKRLPSDTIISPVTAYRIWYVPLSDHLELRSHWIQTLWTPCKRLEAECRNHMTCVCSADPWWVGKKDWGGDVEGTCNAGIYGWETFDQCFDMFMDEMEKLCMLDAEENPFNRIAFGKVYLWGKVLQCERGFRGQFAYPAGIYNTAKNSPQLADIYRVPLLATKDHHTCTR
jgi:hypothetical protein